MTVESLEDRNLLSAVGFESAADAREMTVMSQNLYLGADLAPAMGAIMSGDTTAIIGAVSELWQDVQATNFPERAEAIAGQIDVVEPALIALQEVTLYRTGPVGDPAAAEDVQLDYLDILLDSLEARGLDYEPVVVTEQFDAEFPGYVAPGELGDIRLTDRDVILARTDLPAWQMDLSNVQEGHFEENVQLPIGDTGQVYTLLRGWNSVDVQLMGQEFRFINAHLETMDNPLFEFVQVTQAGELMAGPADTTMSVVLAGDYNSPANQPGSQTYGLLVGAGFEDAWSQTQPGEPGYTYGNQADLLNPDPLIVDPQRIDLVMVRGDLAPRSMDRLGEEPGDQTPSGLWPSDHAGIAATLAVHVAADGTELPWAVVNDDPERPGEQALFLVGTERADRFLVNQCCDQLTVGTSWWGSRETFNPSESGQIYVHTGEGADRVKLTHRVTHDAVIVAGAGGDCVRGGSGNDRIDGGPGRDWLFGRRGDDVILGGPGRDWLFGNQGSDFLVGGEDRDYLWGGPGEDLLIGGTTSHDANAAALEAVMAEWTAERPISQRIENIRSGGGANGSVVLQEDVTVFADGVRDRLSGGPGADWAIEFEEDLPSRRGRWFWR